MRRSHCLLFHNKEAMAVAAVIPWGELNIWRQERRGKLIGKEE
jgi:hypothetical protein